MTREDKLEIVLAAAGDYVDTLRDLIIEEHITFQCTDTGGEMLARRMQNLREAIVGANEGVAVNMRRILI
jgi:hypothetical protein